jgi:hypothetical protein
VWGAYVSWPFACLQLSGSHLRVRVRFFREGDVFEFTPGDVVSIRCRRALFGRKLIIDHRKPDYPQLMVFFPLRVQRLCDELRKAGYTVAGRC